eukprot:365377-Chlamydomonas_euryale.AAC.5
MDSPFVGDRQSFQYMHGWHRCQQCCCWSLHTTMFFPLQVRPLRRRPHRGALRRVPSHATRQRDTRAAQQAIQALRAGSLRQLPCRRGACPTAVTPAHTTTRPAANWYSRVRSVSASCLKGTRPPPIAAADILIGAA